jgi:hypothetical protein
MADTEVAPWGPRDGSAAPATAAAQLNAPAPRSWATQLLVGALSTAVLAAWISLWAGWPVALALVAGVFVHEAGHVLVINWAGCGPSSIRIIPFLGGAATMRRNPDTEFKGVLIALAGPAFGLLAAVPLFVGWALLRDPTWLLAAFMIGMLNLVNLAPAAPLDGAKALGPALARIHPWLERVVLIVIAGVALDWAIQQRSVLFGAVIAFSAVRAFMAGGLRPPARRLGVGEWFASVGLYVLVVALCAGVTLEAVREVGTIRLTPFAAVLGGAK